MYRKILSLTWHWQQHESTPDVNNKNIWQDLFKKPAAIAVLGEANLGEPETYTKVAHWQRKTTPWNTVIAIKSVVAVIF